MENVWTSWHDKHADKIELVAGIDCWIWIACQCKSGHGRVSYNRTPEYAHRAAYTEYYGKIGKGKIVRHMCGNPSCVRPDHLKLGTCNDNAKDMALMFQTRSGLNINDVRGIRKMYNDGVSLKEISEYYGIAYGSVYPIVCYKSFKYVDPENKGKHKIRFPRNLSYDDITAIKIMRLNGMSQREIGNKFGIKQSYVSQIVNGHKWKNHKLYNTTSRKP